ncbi:hypothetical protein A1Q1_07800 [Trichosporon asahii var. asahii CBS 2479]|uniref:Uncharacterized protein n=1 Tax=Trichosporon asahii var. asahii (strain ATCC 90039 / CBS 2479 / JCM 2466 / KCTC 7840 / NBRC 103889/ NCYC 2677 / UAMH 7654) TaxID=1186058 RepID=J5TI36_TRIAS|nr:hypothetical protein A1Q1_07800 [Trichosporon asahii var. asahii CBS 2479]EJT51006.1 hypothetical protein A1Q1_07800 [Trichosporon asahii var. asahii CBS 2479]
MNDEKNTTNKNPRDEKPGEISAQTFLVVLTVRGTNSNDIQQSCEPDESTTGSMSKVLATRASAVPIEGVSTFATAADARSAILEYATRTAKGLTTNEDTLRALDNWVAEFNRVNKP